MLEYQFTDKKVSPYGGIRLVEELYIKSGLKEIIRSMDLGTPGSNRGYQAYELVESFLVGVILGAKRLSHAEILRRDEVLQKIFDWNKGVPSQSTLSRFFRKFATNDNDQLFGEIQRKWFEQFSIDKVTIDIDSTVISRYGGQEGVKKGYNPGKHGRGSHHPLMAFCSELKMVVNAWMRDGNSGASTDFGEFLSQMVKIIPEKKIGLLRADAGFFSDDILVDLEDRGLNYIVSARFNPRLRNAVYEQTQWYPLDNGKDTNIDYCSFEYKADKWETPRRMIVLRKDTNKTGKDTPGKLLFPELEEFENYKYVGFVTNMELSSALIWRTYNQRADCENRIKELKYEYGIEGFCMKQMGATESAFRWIMVAHNLMSLFRMKLLSERRNAPTKATVNFECIAIGSYLTKKSRNIILNLSVQDKRRQFIEGLFQKLSGIGPPFIIPNA